MNTTPAAVSQPAPIPRQTERKGGVSGFTTRIYPRVIGGVCEKCGILDKDAPSTDQYRMCEHYRTIGMLECSYCDPTKDVQEMTRISNLYIYDHPYKKDEYGRPVLGCVCDSFTCQDKFNKEFGK